MIYILKEEKSNYMHSGTEYKIIDVFRTLEEAKSAAELNAATRSTETSKIKWITYNDDITIGKFLLVGDYSIETISFYIEAIETTLFD